MGRNSNKQKQSENLKSKSLREASEVKRSAKHDGQLAVLALVIAVVLSVFGKQGVAKLFWGAFAFLAFLSIYGLLRYRRLSDKNVLSVVEDGIDCVETEVSDSFVLVSQEGDCWMERKVNIGEGVVNIKLLSETKFVDAASLFARKIIENPDVFLNGLKLYISEQKKAFPDKVEEIETLQLQEIDFFDPQDPAVAEVVFKESDFNRVWSCAYKDGKYFNFGP